MIDAKNVKTIPESIKEKILELKALEMKLGHLPPENITVADLYKRIEEQSSEQMEKQTDKLTQLFVTFVVQGISMNKKSEKL